MKDIVIIGAGIVGCTIAKELSKYPLDILVLEKKGDVGEQATSANSAIVHAGYDPKPNTLKAKLNVLGSQMMEEYCRQLDVLYEKKPSLVVAFDQKQLKQVEILYQRGLVNGVKELEIIDQKKLREIEPNISNQAIGALYARSSAIFEPWGLAIAAMENAMDNGGKLRLEAKVTNIEKIQDHYSITINGEDKVLTKNIINCAGVHADEIHDLVNEHQFKITARKGHYFVLDHNAKEIVNNIFFPCPSEEKGKGVLIVPIVHDKILLGPDSEFILEKDDVATQKERLDYVFAQTQTYLQNWPKNSVIRSFAGNRASSDQNDFIIKQAQTGFYDVAGIDSPGLSASPAIACYVEKMVLTTAFPNVKVKSNFIKERRKVIRLNKLDLQSKKSLIKENPRYGKIICRCEKISEQEIIDCIHRNCGARTVKGVKKRVGAGFGRCQGGFCEPRVVEIIARELKLAKNDVKYDQEAAYILTRPSKGE